MLTKKIWLLIGALAILSAGVVGVNAYLSKKAASVVENPGEELLKFDNNLVSHFFYLIIF